MSQRGLSRSRLCLYNVFNDQVTRRTLSRHEGHKESVFIIDALYAIVGVSRQCKSMSALNQQGSTNKRI